MKQKVAQFIEQASLLPQGAKVAVALSGGADSVALLRVLLDLGYRCIALHCNFHLRGESSDADERFVRSLCDEWNVPCEVAHFQTQEYAAENKISIEMAARDLRYTWFHERAEQWGTPYIAVGHHQNDNVETFLLNLIRGTGISGLRGIQPRNGDVIRPLLCVSRDEIETYLSGIGQTYVTDATNREAIYTRNKIRLQLIPLLKTMNPSVEEGIVQTATRMAEIEKVYLKAMAEAMERVKIDEWTFSIPRLLEEVSPTAVLYELLSPYGFNSTQLASVYESLNGESGKRFFSAEYELLKDRTVLLLREKDREQAMPQLVVEEMEWGKGMAVPTTAAAAYIDADKVKHPLLLQTWKSGDWFIPYGMKHRKKIRDFLRDVKLSIFCKESQLVVKSGEDIVWVVNHRTDDRYKITDKTSRVFRLTVSE